MKKILICVLTILIPGLLFASGGGEASSDESSMEAEGSGLGITEWHGAPWGWATLTEYEKETGKTISQFHEAPMLSELVASGQLPPVEDRLPKEPMVDAVLDSVGKYGGSLKMGMASPGVYYPASLHIIEYMLSFDRNGHGAVPNIAQDFRFEDDGKSFFFTLREGMKWSDGAPFTADDILFYWNDVVLNEELTPSPPRQFMPGDKLMDVEKIDDYSVKYSFSIPYYSFVYHMNGAGFQGAQAWAYMPKHTYRGIHIKYNANADGIAKENGFEAWWEYLNSKRYKWYKQDQVDVPILGPWGTSQILPEGVVFDRNAYYYKIDSEGNQLPYIDKIVATVFNDVQTLTLKIVAGEYDYADWSTNMNEYPTYMSGADEGNYTVWLTPNLWTSNNAWYINQNYSGNAADAEILQDIRFRKALSLAINRQEINDAYCLGVGSINQATVHPSATFYEDSWGAFYRDFDVEGAKAQLDEMGMDKFDSDGFRLRPDGKPFLFTVYASGDIVPESWLELVISYWKAIKINAVLKIVERQYLMELKASGEHMALAWVLDGASEVALLGGLTTHFSGWGWAPLWQSWFQTGGTSGIEPPDHYKEYVELGSSIPFLGGAEQESALRRVVSYFTENLYAIGTVGTIPKPGIVNNNLRNVAMGTFTDNADIGCGTYNRLYQLYWDN